MPRLILFVLADSRCESLEEGENYKEIVGSSLAAGKNFSFCNFRFLSVL